MLSSLASLPALPHQTCFVSALPSSQESQREGKNEFNYTDVLGQRDHPLVHALDALAGLQRLALGLGAIGLPEVLQVGCFGSRGLQRAWWGGHKEESRCEMMPVFPSLNAIPARYWGTVSETWLTKPPTPARVLLHRLALPAPALTLLFLPQVMLPVPLLCILQQLGPFLMGQAG